MRYVIFDAPRGPRRTVIEGEDRFASYVRLAYPGATVEAHPLGGTIRRGSIELACWRVDIAALWDRERPRLRLVHSAA